MKGYVVDFQAHRGKDGEPVVKVLCIASFAIGAGVPSTRVLSFKPPYDRSELPPKVRKSNNWLVFTRGFWPWHKGANHYSTLPTVLKGLDGEIYVKGLQKSAFVQGLVGRRVHNLEDLGCPKIDDLCPRLECAIHENQTLDCCLVKARGYANWCLENITRQPSHLVWPAFFTSHLLTSSISTK